MELSKMMSRSQFQVASSSFEYIELLKDLKTQIENCPALYAQDGLGDEAMVYIHYFYGGSDWWITEIDQETREAFGFVILSGNVECAELGYISIDEIIDLPIIQLDFHWKPIPLREAKRNSKYFI